VFNGYANQYKDAPLTVGVGKRIRLHVMNAGPTTFSAFHVIGAMFDRVWVDGNPANEMVGLQTWQIAPGGAATFDLVIPAPGLYPFVTHSFAYTGLGALGLIKVT
jgi:nitrite reductase (NO-forming)